MDDLLPHYNTKISTLGRITALDSDFTVWTSLLTKFHLSLITAHTLIRADTNSICVQCGLLKCVVKKV